MSEFRKKTEEGNSIWLSLPVPIKAAMARLFGIFGNRGRERQLLPDNPLWLDDLAQRIVHDPEELTQAEEKRQNLEAAVYRVLQEPNVLPILKVFVAKTLSTTAENITITDPQITPKSDRSHEVIVAWETEVMTDKAIIPAILTISIYNIDTKTPALYIGFEIKQGSQYYYNILRNTNKPEDGSTITELMIRNGVKDVFQRMSIELGIKIF